MDHLTPTLPAKRTYKPIHHIPVGRGHNQRRPQGALVRDSGPTTLNMASTTLLDELARAEGLNQDQYSVSYGLDVAHRIIAIYPVPHDTDGSAPIHRHKQKSYITLNLASILGPYPQLMLDREVHCPAMRDTDTAGTACMILSFQNAVIHRKRSRST